MLRALALATLLLLPGAAAWSVELRAPPAAAAGLPYLVEACVDAAGELRVEPSRYAPVAAGCSTLVVQGANLTARLRPVGGAAKATARASVALLDAPLADVDANGTLALLDAAGATILRVPPPFLPLLPGAATWRDAEGERALPPPDRPALLDALGPPFSGVVLRNDGVGPLRLAGRTLGGAALPDATLAPGARVFLGAAAPPGEALVPWKAPRAGVWALRAGAREEARIDASTPAMPGRTNASAEPFAIAGPIRLFATPDAGVAPLVSLVDSARREVILEGYTFASPDLAAALARALARGVTVRALLEGAPVGGRPAEEAGLVSALVARGAQVAFLGGATSFPARYPTLHAKAIVVDEARVLLSTDNFLPGSYPPAPGAGATRGFGLVVEDSSLASRLADVLRADLAPWPDVHPDPGEAPPADLAPSATLAAGPAFESEGAWNATLVLSPDDGVANETMLRLLRTARERIDVEMLFADARWGDGPDPFVDALVAAARRNVTVRLLLDGRDDAGRNRALAEALDAQAAREGLDLVARVDASGRTLHAKAVVADESLYVGSMNWGLASATRNREAGLILWNASDAAAWMRARMAQDWAWRPVEKRSPGPGLAALVLALTWAGSRRRRRSPRTPREPGAGRSPSRARPCTCRAPRRAASGGTSAVAPSGSRPSRSSSRRPGP